jgi:hypothetical protein
MFYSEGRLVKTGRFFLITHYEVRITDTGGLFVSGACAGSRVWRALKNLCALGAFAVKNKLNRRDAEELQERKIFALSAPLR